MAYPDQTITQLELELKNVTSRDWHLWSLAILLLIVVTAGFFALGLPLFWSSSAGTGVRPYLSQLLFGLMALCTLVSLYLRDQKQQLNSTRDRLIRGLINGAGKEPTGFIDPLTGAYSSAYLQQALIREAARTDRTGSRLALARVSVGELRRVVRNAGPAAGDHLLVACMQVLRATFRGTDVLCRTSDNEFTLLLPDTNSSQAAYALARLHRAVTAWNNASSFKYKLTLSFAAVEYGAGGSLSDLLSVLKHAVPVDNAESINPPAELFPPTRGFAQLWTSLTSSSTPN
jgi:diguanylate cyclase (GGDEF)-like protein